MKWWLRDAQQNALISVWVHQVWRSDLHIEKVFLLTLYETLMTLIGYFIIANQIWCKHMIYRCYRFGHHTKWEPQRLCSSYYFTSVPRKKEEEQHYKIKLSCKWKLHEFCMSLQAGCCCSPPHIYIYTADWSWAIESTLDMKGLLNDTVYEKSSVFPKLILFQLVSLLFSSLL